MGGSLLEIAGGGLENHFWWAGVGRRLNIIQSLLNISNHREVADQTLGKWLARGTITGKQRAAMCL